MVSTNLNRTPNIKCQAKELFARVEPYIYGAKLLGAGGGGFMLMVCKSTADALEVRAQLEDQPPNNLSRFFDFSVNTEGLIVTVLLRNRLSA